MARLCSTMDRQPLISWPKVMGTASWRWVRPVLTTSLFSSSSRRRQAVRPSRAGKRRLRTAVAAAM